MAKKRPPRHGVTRGSSSAPTNSGSDPSDAAASERPAKLPDRERPVGRQASRPKNPGKQNLGEGLAKSFKDQGKELVWATWAGTALLVVVSVLGLVAIDAFAPVVVGVSGVMFLAGSALFFVAYAKAIGRSRFELIGIGGLYFLSGNTAPKHIRTSMMWSFGLEVALVIGLIVAKPFSSMVFTALAPVYPIGLAGMWAALYGQFPARPAK
ncbi:MAG: hypothetical protein WC184_02825 [Acidimicrobiia bacterium]